MLLCTMGYLMKEALKTLCGVNQWSYAVFWKIGCQNPKLLIWEECYYEPASWSVLPRISGNENPESNFQDFNSSWVSNEIRNLQAGDKVQLLVNKMMMDNHVNILGEGLVGRVAFTGNHQWILSDTYYKEAHPPEVLKEVCQQFSAGIKTVAVIPVLPHGVVQFGSCLKIMENMGFVNDVTSLVLQLGYVPGVLQSENYGPKEPIPRIGAPVCLGNSTPGDLTFESKSMNASSVLDSFNYVSSSAQTSIFDSQPCSTQIQNNLRSMVAPFQASSSNTAHANHHPMKLDSSQNQLMNGVAKAEVIPSNLDMWTNQHASIYIPSSTIDMPSNCSSALIPGNMRNTNQKISTDMLMSAINPISSFTCSSNGGSVTLSSVEMKGTLYADVKPVSGGASVSDAKNPANENLHSLLGYSSYHMDKKFTKTELNAVMEKIDRNSSMVHDISVSQIQKSGTQMLSSNNTKYDDACVQQKSGDDLFDILGAEFKNQLLSTQWNGCSNNESFQNMHDWNEGSNIPTKKSFSPSDMYSNSDSGIFSLAATDHLLDAVVSKVQPSAKQGLDDTVSCGTTLTNASSSSAPSTSLPYGRFGVSEQMKGELYGVPKYLAKAGGTSSSALRTGASKEDSGTYSQGSSIYGSQISSWIEKGQNTKQSNSVSTGYSKKPDETSKPNRKRLKPGENPRPRPKDRQMIQDRVKELREIVPNGAKCSIDALLERTIKHMLFLQSVTKHSDKLKQAGESKIMSKDGGLLLRDNFEGGATWAYEVGSQSMVCPIIVEDLNQPRQMLVEMLCEERGLFLEIADIIRGLGLTILKGVMETQNGKIWARFAVEANRDVTRMEIFIALVRLLEQTSKTGVPQANNMSSENMMPQQFHQAAPSVPVTHSLQ